MNYYHVTPAWRWPSIEATGLSLQPPTPNFRTGGGFVSLAVSEPQAERWAREIARKLGHTTEFALLSVEVPTGTQIVTGRTSLRGVKEARIRRAIPSTNVQLLRFFTANV